MSDTPSRRETETGVMFDSGGEVWGKEIAATFSNHFSVSINPYYARIAFGEGFGSGDMNESKWHTAIVMAMPDAKALMQALMDTFARVEPKWAKMQEEAIAQLKAGKDGPT